MGAGGKGWLQTTPFTPASCKLPVSDVISWWRMCPLSPPVIIYQKAGGYLDNVFWCPWLLGALLCPGRPTGTPTLHTHFLDHLPRAPYSQVPRKVPHPLHARR